MQDSEILAIYVAQSENVSYCYKILEGIQRDINREIKKSNIFQINVKTKLLSLVYSSWSEAQFTQILFTENGFRYTEICKIKSHKTKNGIAEGWKYMIELALAKVGNLELKPDLKDRLDRLLILVSVYIKEPSLIRNKMAHGQWLHALNSENTALNSELSQKLAKLDSVEIGKGIQVHRYLGFIVRDLVQSPKASFHNHYWTNIVNLEQYLKSTEKWTLASKKTQLSKKPIQNMHMAKVK